MTERGDAAIHTLASIAEMYGSVTAGDYQAAYDTGRPPRPRRHPEADFQASVLDLAKLYGWAAYHTFDSRDSVAGFPDLELCRVSPRVRIIKAELKSATGKPTSEQTQWLNLYAAMGEPIEVYLWRPQHLEAIAAILEPEWKCDANTGMFGLWSLRGQPLEVRALPTQARQRSRASAKPKRTRL